MVGSRRFGLELFAGSVGSRIAPAGSAVGGAQYISVSRKSCGLPRPESLILTARRLFGQAPSPFAVSINAAAAAGHVAAAAGGAAVRATTRAMKHRLPPFWKKPSTPRARWLPAT